MTPRSIRRAAERKARKLLQKQNRSSAMPARADEAAVLSEPKISNDPAERKQMKAARKAALRELALPEIAAAPEPPTTISPAQLAANRANAQLSTGATSAAGKTTSSMNARDEAAVLSEPKIQTWTGLTRRTVDRKSVV